MELKIRNGKANYLMKAGKELVHNAIDADIAEKIVKNGKMTVSKKYKGFSMCIDGVYYFEAVSKNGKSDREDDNKNE